MMKAFAKLSNTICCLFAFTFVLASNTITKAGSFFFFGEPKCPKSLL